MTLVITADAYLSYFSLMDKHSSSSSSGSGDGSMLTSNWKHGLFYNQDGTATGKTFAAFLLTLQGLFSFSAIFNFTGLMVSSIFKH
jgi:hypothetical protein